MTDEYQGPEKRREQRRKSADRREEVRFELDNDNRRKGSGRRHSDGDIWEKHNKDKK